jgi:hypothetical protein
MDVSLTIKLKVDNSQLSVNSSAFSLFTPNEEIRTFFHKEFQK